MKDIYTDGSCINNPGNGGWAWLCVENNKITRYNSKKVANTTNNQMEMIAAIEAIRNNEGELNIYTDSIYLKNGITTWIFSWLKTNWKNNTVKNIELWKELFALTQNRKIHWNWVKAHSTNEFNNKVDILANSAARS